MTSIHILGLPLIDILVIIAYFAVVLWIGYRAMKKVKNSEDYFLGGRKFGKAIQTFAAFGQGTSADSAVTTTTMVSTNGAAGIGMGLINGIATMPIFWMNTMWYRRLRYLSLAEFFEERYNSRIMSGFYALAQTFMFMIIAAVGFTAMSKTVAAIAEKPVAELTQAETSERELALELKDLNTQDYRLLDDSQKLRLEELSKAAPQRSFSHINRDILTIVLAVIILLYAVSGGLEAAFITDMIQGIFIIILTLILIPFAMIRINETFGKTGFMGTFEAFHENLPDSFFKILGSPNVPQFTWYFILAFGILAVVNTAVQANQLTAAGSAKDDETARYGFVMGLFIKRYCYVIWGFVAMMTMLLFASEVSDPDYVWGLATRQLLPVGLVGLMIACLMAALMSTADALMLTCASLLTNSIYRPLFPGKSEKHYVFAGRVFCLAYIIGGVTITLLMDDVLTLFLFMLSFNSMIAASFWVGMVWRRATRVAAWASILITFVFTLVLPILVPLVAPGVRSNESLLIQTKSYPVENTYTAKQVDVDQRVKDIEVWETLNARGEADTPRPNEIQAGEPFIKQDYIKSSPVFWQNGIGEDKDGKPIGQGMLKVELVAIHALGFDLTQNKSALNETIGAVLRLIVPFGVLFLVSLFTRREEKARLDFFYDRLRTPASADHAQDAIEVQRAKDNPGITTPLRLFPNSNWEFRKWTKKDWKGQGIIVVAMSVVCLMMYLLVTIGG